MNVSMISSFGSCTICTSSFHSKNVAALHCGHTFHYECISRWFDHGKNCPTCRIRITRKQIIRQLFFTVHEDIDSEDTENVDYAQKCEQLCIELETVKSENCSAKESIGALQKENDLLNTKLAREKERLASKLPALEQENRELKMMLEDQRELERDLRRYKNRLRATEFFKLITKGKTGELDTALDKYLTTTGEPNSEQFISLLHKQLDALKAERKTYQDNISSYERRLREFEKREVEYKNLLQALKTEAKELRASALKSDQTPYNAKLKPIFDKNTPKRLSIGFDFDDSLDIDEDFLNSAFKKPNKMTMEVRKVDKMNERCPLSQRQGNGNAKSPGLNFSDVSESDISVPPLPPALLSRVMAGSPKKGSNGMGCSKRATPYEVKNALPSTSSSLFSSVAPRPLKKLPSKRNVAAGSPTKSAKLTKFFSSSSLNDTIVLD